MNKQQLQSQMSLMSMNELRSMRDILQREIEQRGQEIKYELRIGDKVKVNHSRTAGMIFNVVEIKRKKAVVKTVDGARYNVALQLLERAE